MSQNDNYAHKEMFCLVDAVYTLCWVKYNPALGQIWTNPAIGLFLPSGWVTAQKVGLNI